MGYRFREDRSFLFNSVDNFLLFNKSTAFVNGSYDKVYLQEMCSNFNDILSFCERGESPESKKNLDLFLSSELCSYLDEYCLEYLCYRSGFEWMHSIVNPSEEYHCSYSDEISSIAYFIGIAHWYSGLKLSELLTKLSLDDLYPSVKDYCIEEVFRFVDYEVLGKNSSRWDDYSKSDDLLLEEILNHDMFNLIYRETVCEIVGKIFYRVHRSGIDLDSFCLSSEMLELFNSVLLKSSLDVERYDTSKFLQKMFSDYSFLKDDEFEIDFESKEYWCGFTLGFILCKYYDRFEDSKDFLSKYNPSGLIKDYESLKGKPYYEIINFYSKEEM